MLRRLPILAIVLMTGCSVEDGGGAARPDEPTTTAAAAATSEAPAEEPDRPSTAFVRVGDATYDLPADCYAPGAGEIVVTAAGTAPTGDRVEVYVQAFPAAPYLGISVTGTDTLTTDDAEPVVYEAAVDRPLDFERFDDVIRVDDVALVTDLDLDTGTGTAAGTGTVVIECGRYVDGLPPGFSGG